jgi:hypothetical protein
MPRLVGKEGSCYLSQGGFGVTGTASHKLGDLFNITFEFDVELAECGAKLEVNQTYAMGVVNARLTGERYITDSLTSNSAGDPGGNEIGGSVMGYNFANSVPIAGAPTSGNNYLGRSLFWLFYTIDTVANKGFVVTGEGFLERVTQNNPRGTASEVWEIRCSGVNLAAIAN